MYGELKEIKIIFKWVNNYEYVIEGLQQGYIVVDSFSSNDINLLQQMIDDGSFFPYECNIINNDMMVILDPDT